MQRAEHLRQLVLDSQYVVSEELVAAAIVARAATRRLVPGAAFRNDRPMRQLRSYRPSKLARSLRARETQLARDARILSTRRRRS